CRYADHPLPGSSAKNRLSAVMPKIDCRQSISIVGGRLREKSIADDRLREKSNVGGRLSEKKGRRRRRGKEEKKKRGEEERIPSVRATSLPAGRGHFFSRAGRKIEATLNDFFCIFDTNFTYLQLGFDALYFSRIDYQDREKRKDTKSLEVVWRGSRTLGSSVDVSGFYFEVNDESPVIQVAGTRTTRYQAVPPKIDRRRPIEGEIDRWRSIEGEKGKKKKRKRKKKRKEEYLFSYAILAGASLPVREPHAIGRFRQKSTVGGRLKGEIDCRRSIEGEIDRRRLIEREKGKKKKRKKKKKKRKEEKKNTYCPRAVLARAPSLLASCCRPRVASTLGSRALFLPHEEKDRGDDGRVNVLYSTPSIYTNAKHAANESWPLKTDDFFP
ncbi:hypothetical protein GW17_00040492, partial [Ensete ventricosum]